MTLPFDWNPYEDPPSPSLASDFGWGSYDPFLALSIDQSTRLVIELGSFHGASSRWIAAHLPEGARLICVDSFCGDSSHWLMCRDKLHVRGGRSNIFDVFRAGVIAGNLQDRIFPLVMDMHSGAGFLMHYVENGTLPLADYIYVDGAHDAFAAAADVKDYLPLLRPGGWMAFDDCNLPGVKAAVESVKYSAIEWSADKSKARIRV
jgi:hypothetical protein